MEQVAEQTRLKSKSALFALLGLILSPLAVAHALSPPADSVHFCAPFDYEQGRRDHPRPAGKRLAALNRGEPRTVRMIYFLPNDRPYSQEVVDKMKAMIRQVQAFYAEQMQAHGYGNTTFRFETDSEGEPLVHRVDGQHPESRYYDLPALMEDEAYQIFDLPANIYLYVIDNGRGGTLARGVGGWASWHSKNSGKAMVPSGLYFTTVAHELGHTFGLQHDFRDGAYIMSYGPGQNRLSAWHAEFLSVHPYFNADIPSAKTPPPTIELISPLAYPVGSVSVSIRFKVGDSKGLHQIFLLVNGGDEVKTCHGLAGEKEAVVEFKYDGVTPSGFYSSNLPERTSHPMKVMVVDTDGEITNTQEFALTEISPYQIASLGHTYVDPEVRVHGGSIVQEERHRTRLSFSPDGATLASRPERDGTIKLWDVASRRNIATLEHLGRINSVVFSPDGATLASGAGETIKLWDVASRRNIATLEHLGRINSVVFSPDGATLASGAGETIKLWDVASRRNVTTLEAYKVNSVVFSPDGATLASGSWEGPIVLWDVSEWTGEGTIPTVEQAMPHTLTKISGDGQGGPASTQLAAPFVVSVLDQSGTSLAGVPVSFSVTAGGGMLSTTTNPCTVQRTTSSTTATTGANGQASVRLTLGGEPGTNTVEATVEGLEPVTFTATAAEQAVPHRLTKVCGDSQEGIAGAVLDKSFVVSVADEDGSAIAGVVVSFAVTAGGGTLSSATATTDANGRAATRLTLGSDPGTNTVGATVAGLASVTFTATGQEDPLVSLFDAFGGGKLVALPDRTQLLQNAPNPFNSQTVLSYFLLEPGPVRLEVFALSGQRVAVLHQGPQQAGYHRLHWDGRDAAGHSVASGAYLYRLVTDEAVLTRKLILLR